MQLWLRIKVKYKISYSKIVQAKDIDMRKEGVILLFLLLSL